MRKRLVVEIIEHDPDEWLELYTARKASERHLWLHLTPHVALHLASSKVEIRSPNLNLSH